MTPLSLKVLNPPRRGKAYLSGFRFFARCARMIVVAQSRVDHVLSRGAYDLHLRDERAILKLFSTVIGNNSR